MGSRVTGGMAVAPAQTEVAADRVRFLTDEPLDTGAVRPTILASWRRSQDLGVPADRIALPFDADPPVDSPLVRSATPVLRRLHEQLTGQSVSVILTDPGGVVLSRMTGDAGFERHLDSVLLAPGFNYSEEHVGTNGIGTALEVGGPAHVFGHEHYAENLDRLSCAGVPIHHPMSGRLLGAVDLTCWHRDAGVLLMTLAKATADQIGQEYLRTCRRRAGMVLALNDETVMINDQARAMLDPADQARLLTQVEEAFETRQALTTTVELGSGRTVVLHTRLVSEGERAAGVVVHVDMQPGRMVAPEGEGTHGMRLPGLVGRSVAWRQACREIEAASRAGRWIVVEGEAGVGKLALLRAVQLRRQPVRRVTVLDATEAATDPHWPGAARDALLGDGDGVVVRRADALSATRLRALRATLQQADARRGGRWVALTIRPGEPSPALRELLGLFPSTVWLPPLRLRSEDLEQLIPLFLSRLGVSGRLSCSPEAMRLLVRAPWPGNAAQVHDLLRDVVQRRRTGVIQASDLPPELHTVSRRVLSPLESLERDAIVRCLNATGGNKAEAARSLGMSRATIYRKIHDYGILVGTGVPPVSD